MRVLEPEWDEPRELLVDEPVVPQDAFSAHSPVVVASALMTVFRG